MGSRLAQNKSVLNVGSNPTLPTAQPHKQVWGLFFNKYNPRRGNTLCLPVLYLKLFRQGRSQGYAPTSYVEAQDGSDKKIEPKLDFVIGNL